MDHTKTTIVNYLQFDFETESAEQSEKLVALLAEQGFEGFEEEGYSLSAFIQEHNFSQDEFTKVIDRFERVKYTQTILENINWNKQWEENFSPVLVNDFVAVRAAFHAPVAAVKYEIIVTPKMSFGTGHHATTYLMILQMQGMDFVKKSVLDFGTGTGILAILACKMGALRVVAIDYDEWSIRNATENIEQNRCESILIEQSDSVPVNEKFNIILANINLNVIIANLSLIAAASFPGTTILLSGFLKENEGKMVDAVTGRGFKYLLTMQRGDWIALMVKKC
ncbi:MAG: 50S ribosomal protein L11 methyltransferase [Ferruginibacter sp.]